MTVPPTDPSPQSASESEQHPSVPHLSRPSTVQMSYVAGVFTATIMPIWLLIDAANGRLYGAEFVMLGIPMLLGVLTVYLAWTLHRGARLRKWMMFLAWIGYAGVLYLFLLGASSLYGAYATTGADPRQLLMLLGGAAMAGCSVALLLVSERIETGLRGGQRRLGR